MTLLRLMHLMKYTRCILKPRPQIDGCAFCSSSSKGTPDLMNLGPRIIVPGPLSPFKSRLTNFFIIRPTLDPNFQFGEFTRGARNALEFISGRIVTGTWEELEDVVDPGAISEVKNNLMNWPEYLIPNIRVKEHHILFSTTMFNNYDYKYYVDDANARKQVGQLELSVIFHYVPGHDAKQHLSLETFQERAYVAQYRFFREYINKKPQSGWIVNGLNHFRMSEGIR